MPKSKKTSHAKKVRVPKKSASSNTIMLIVGGVLVLLVLFVLARNLKNSTEVSKNNTVPADTLNDIPSTTTDATSVSTTTPPVSSQPGKPGWNLNFNANTAFGLTISAGVNDQGELYIRPDFQTNLRNLAPKPSLSPSPTVQTN